MSFERVAIIGLGLLGGSIGLAVQEQLIPPPAPARPNAGWSARFAKPGRKPWPMPTW